MHPAHRSFSPDGSGHAYMDTTSTRPEEIFSLSSAEEERAGERRPILSNAPAHEPARPPPPSPPPTGGEGVRRTGEGERTFHPPSRFDRDYGGLQSASRL